MKSAQGWRRLLIVVSVLGLALFLGLAAASRALFNQSEDRLLQQHTREAASAIQLSVNQLKAPLDAAAALALGTDGDGGKFDQIIGPYVGEGKQFSSAALYRVGSTTPVASVGIPTSLAAAGNDKTSAMLDTATSKPFSVVDLLRGDGRRLGYAVADSAKNAKFVVYAERTLSPDPNTRQRHDQPFSQLDYAMYLGNRVTPDHLVTASVRDLPLGGRTAQEAVAFGNTELLLVMTPMGHLSGDLFANLWWIVALSGIAVVAAFAFLTKRLLDRREVAFRLASENEQLYEEQRHIAETLQLGLLPQHLVAPEGISVAARYWPAGAANLIGGDFYDMFAVDDHRWAIAIGDVCGKGIEAAGLTGLARHTLRAAARSARSPDEVLHAVHQALRDHVPSTFCTACFGFLYPGEDQSYRLEMSLGGHPQPLLRRANGSVQPVGELGMLLGMIEPRLHTTVVDLYPGDTLVFYTDGLTDAPAAQAVTVDELLSLLQVDGNRSIEGLADSIRTLKRGRRPSGSGDDTALIIVRYDPVPHDAPIEESTSIDAGAASGGIR